MKTNNRLLRFLSLLLCLVMIVTVIPVIDVSAISGSSFGPASSGRHSNFSSHTSEKGFSSTAWAFRMKAIEIENNTGDFDYFTIDGSSGAINFKDNIISVENDYTSWTYFTPVNKTRTYSFYVDGAEFTCRPYGIDSAEMNAIKGILGISHTNAWSEWDRGLQSYAKVGTGDSDELGKFLGVDVNKNGTEGVNYYIVVEAMYAMFDSEAPVSGDDYSEKFIFTTYQDYVNRPGTRDKLSCRTRIGSSTDNCFKDVNRYINQGNIAPFKLNWASGNPKMTGFAIYGDITNVVSNEDKSSLNIVVEYKGEPNTTNGEFAAAASLVQQRGNTNNYWNISEGSWKETENKQELLQTTGKVDVDDPYVIVFEDYYYIQSSSLLRASALVNAGDACNSGYSLTWNTPHVNNGDYNVGYSVRPSALNGKRNTSAILNKLKDNLNSVKYFDRLANNNYKTISIIDACIDNVNRAFGKSDSDCLSSSVNSNDVKLLKDKKLGTAVEFVVKSKEVTSHKVTVNVDSSGNASSSETWNDKYSSAECTSVDINSSAVCFLVVPNANRNDNAVVSALSGRTYTSASVVLNTAASALSNVKLRNVGSGCSIGLGCQQDTIDGYTVYEILVDDEDVVGLVELPAYMLNRYFPNIIQTSSSNVNHLIKYQLNKDFTVKNNEYDGQETCGNCGSVLTPTVRPSDYKDWRIEWKDNSSGTVHVGYDENLRGRYFLKMSGNWAHADRNELVNWVSEDTKAWASESNYVMDYGFNLIRESVGDNRAISGISYSSYSDIGDTDNILRYSSYFGVEPQDIKPSSAKRDSFGVVGEVTDTLTMSSRFTRTGGTGYSDKANLHSHGEIGHWTDATEDAPSTYVVDSPAVGITYYTFLDKTALGFRRNINAKNMLNYSFKSTVYKYETELMDVGKNDKIASGDNTAIKPATEITSGVVEDSNEYRFANVRCNNIVHNFYPEVKLAYKIGGTTFDNTPYKTVATIGEILRKSESSSLYLFKISGTGVDAVTGTTYSDAAQGGTVTKGSTNVTIPAGADVYVAADPSGISIDLYGYALDCINADTDATFKPSSNITRQYSSVVKSGVNVDEIWNGNPNKEALVNHFSDWCNNILDLKNYSADFELYTGGNKKASNFSAVIGNIKRNNTVSEDGVYQLQVAKGVLVHNTDYDCLIEQIKADYGCASKAEAEELFEASGIYTSIVNAIESCNKSINKSGVASPGAIDISSAEGGSADWTDTLGGNGNWYDECVSTFVVRRFTNTGNYFKDITAVDKIDYGLAPNSSDSNKQNANYNTLNAEWKLNIFFNPDESNTIENLLVGSGRFYNPTDSSTFDEAKRSFTVLMYGVPVTNADFNISETTTSNFGY